MLFNGTEVARDLRKICKYGYDHKAKEESKPHGLHLVLTLEQTNSNSVRNQIFGIPGKGTKWDIISRGKKGMTPFNPSFLGRGQG